MTHRVSGRRTQRRGRIHLGAAALLAGVAATACVADRSPTAPIASTGPRRDVVQSVASSDNAALQWGAAELAVIRAVRPAPTVCARLLAVVHTAMYDAWAAYDEHAVGTMLGATLRRPPAERTEANKAKAVSYAAYRALMDLYPAQRPTLDALMASLGYDPADVTTDLASAAGVGNVAAAAVLAARHHDGANQLGDLHAGAYSDWTGYAPVNTPDQIIDPNRWQPLRVIDALGNANVQRFATPQWGRVTPFALTSGSQLRPPPPPMYPSGQYVKEVEELLKYSAELTDEQKVIAEYWADNPSTELPPGHWCLISAYVSHRDGHTLDDDVKVLFALGNALLDASIAVWDAKVTYDYVRPVTAIHFLKAGKPVRAWGGRGRGTVLMRGEDWQPYQVSTIVTPAFAEYVSGHSTFSAAAATVLALATGSDAYDGSVTIPVGWSKVEPGLVPAKPITLTWRTFSEAADQAGLSRRYGGIHFPAGDLEGRAMGRKIGAQVWEKASAYFAGTAATAVLATR